MKATLGCRASNSSLPVIRQNVLAAKRLSQTPLSAETIRQLKQITGTLKISIELGDLRLLNGKWYVTHTGLLRLAVRRRCAGINVQTVREFCDPSTNRWVFEAIVYAHNGHAFYGYGDADPSNVSPLVRGAEMRVAETRAVNRALRKAYGVGLCSVEELGSNSGLDFVPPSTGSVSPKVVSINGHGKLLLRDQLRDLVREYGLDAEQVKRYAADFCDTQHVREASRELVEDFIQQLQSEASSDREALVEKLNQYAESSEIAPANSLEVKEQSEEVRS